MDASPSKTLAGLRLSIVLNTLAIGGAERQALLLAAFAKEQLHMRTQIIGLERKTATSFQQNCSGIPVYSLGCGFIDFKKSPILAIRRWLRFLRSESPDILLPYVYWPNMLCQLSWRLSPRCRASFWNQRDEGINFPSHRFGRNISRLAARNASGVIANSAGSVDFLIQSLGIEPSIIHCIPNGIQLAHPIMTREEWRKKLEISEKTLAGVMLANLTANKDHETLLHAWALLAKSLEPSNMPVLILAGREEETALQIKCLTNHLSISSHIRIIGHVDDVAGLLKSVDFGLLSSRSEGCPNAVLEYMAAGLPTIGTNIRGIREVLGENSDRFLFPQGNAEVAANIVKTLINFPGIRKHLGESNRLRQNSRYSILAMCRSYAKIFETALSIRT